jgi:hypothetical protein
VSSAIEFTYAAAPTASCYRSRSGSMMYVETLLLTDVSVRTSGLFGGAHE